MEYWSPGATATKSQDWVAVKELKLSYHTGDI